MPRLVGKKSNHGFLAGIIVVAVIAAAGTAEYFGYVHFIPGWNQDQKAVSQGIPNLNTVIS